jgi:hypothetical protein
MFKKNVATGTRRNMIDEMAIIMTSTFSEEKS